ncbi:scavenger receptor class B member 1 [Linepithema humile]|uniref:scavenger receptor class B member 1 n=1 Tax=Linepithema humile TaxID=83485 RepID=UPI000623A0D9|nr:PREDICTED: scavenger receptor class B member 1-like [Linepithema humile]
MTISVTDAALDMEKKAINRCTRRNPFRSWPAWLFCIVFLTSFTGFYIIWCTNVYNNYLLSQMELRNGTNSFKWWLQPPFSLMYKIHVFNYTNVDKFESGVDEKLRVQELGPYIYAEKLNRVNVAMNEDDTVTYQDKRSYEWLSGSPEDDVVVVPNVPLLFATAFARDLSFPMRWVIRTTLQSLHERPFINETVGGFLWGYDTKLFDIAKPFMMLQRDIPFDKFGLLAIKKGIDKNRITVNTGSQDFDKLGIIEKINGKDNREIWGDERCDKIGGTNGNMFPPYVVKNTSETIYVYSKEICRKLPFDFAEQVTVFDMPSLRYKIKPDTFNCSTAQNDCFCPREQDNSRICPPAGLFNISACSDNAPLLTSFPHFYGGDKSLLKLVDGLNPRQEDHESFLDLHPRLAMPISGWSRLQMNIEIRQARIVPVLGNLKDGMILPLIWIETGVDDLPESVIDVIHAAHFTANTVENVLQWCTLIIMILSLSALVACFWKYRMEQDTDVLRKSLSVQNTLLA